MDSQVSCRQIEMEIPTYPVPPGDRNPMFYEWRGVQGSKGNIYPHPIQDQISSERVSRSYQAIVLENEYIELVLLPELGGRIYTALDKTNGYDFFYRHQVIKPALIGTFGPWISGGLEFNWPQHHRPSTYDPTEYSIEEYPDGSVTVWMGEHEPLNRTKGMVGVTLYPGKALVETKVRLYNRSAYPQSFLWWENAAVPINEQYQVVFPPDVHYAVYHGKAPVIGFPIGKGQFAGGNDYGDGTDISYWANSPGATSFFSAPSKYEFFGGYDHARGAGVVHIADGGISQGKKYFTWGNGPYGHTWQRNLYDYESEGEYLELMAGVYTDNQPDFSWIMPYETRTFSQYWMPVQKIGAMKNACSRAALNLQVKDGNAFIGAYASESLKQTHVILSAGGIVLHDETVDLAPGRPYIAECSLPSQIAATDLLLQILTSDGERVLAYRPEPDADSGLPEPYKLAPWPPEVKTLDELYLIGLHHEQYHSTLISPEIYWLEGLRRDPGDARCNLGMGKLHLRRGDFEKAETYLRAAIDRLMMRNQNPYDGEALFYLGLTLQYQGKFDEAYARFYKAAWNYAWQSAAYFHLAEIDCRRRQWTRALEHLGRSLSVNAQHARARALRCAALRHCGQADAAVHLAEDSIANDPLDFYARFELCLADPGFRLQREKELCALMRNNPQTALDIALDYANAGLDEEADELLALAAGFNPMYPMVAYARGFLAQRAGDEPRAADLRRAASEASPDYCFPWRLEEMLILQDALRAEPADARAAYYLGNLLYDKKRWREGEALWRRSVEIDPGFAIAWRNLGVAAYNLDADIDRSLAHYARAQELSPDDPRLLLEADFLLRRKAVSPESRLQRLLACPQVTAMRDDLVLEQMALYNRLGQPEKALELARSRNFHPWEGGEGAVAGQYANAYWLLGRQALEEGEAQRAAALLRQGLDYPANLGEQARDTEAVRLRYYLGLALEAMKETDNATTVWRDILAIRRWPGMLSLVDYYRALTLRHLGRTQEGEEALCELKREAEKQLAQGITSPYASRNTSNPTFYEDPNRSHRIHYYTLAGLACLGLGDFDGARSMLGVAAALDPAELTASEELKRLV